MTIQYFFYDGDCPLCQWEVGRLKEHDKEKKISFVDLHEPDFAQRHPNIDWEQAYKTVHAQLTTGEIITGTEVIYQAWSQVGFQKFVAPLKWPVLKTFFYYLYWFVARYRYLFSRIFAGEFRHKK